MQANKQINMFGGDAASVILVLTDGILDDLALSIAEVREFVAYRYHLIVSS